MHEFFRGPAWVSAGAQATWEPLIRAGAGAWAEIESLTVSEGLRDSALFSVTPAELVEMTRAASSQGLEATPLGETLVGQSYSAGPAAVGARGLRVALHRPGLRPAWLAAWRASDDAAIGRLLGFPDCCVQFFKRVWATSSKRDTTMSMAAGASGLGCILLRWLGVRLVGHLPCGHGCDATEQQAIAHAALGRRCGLADGVDALERLLKLPIEYTALHGVGVITTPLFRFMFSTDYTAQREAFSKPGAITDPEPASCRDNGFSSREAMEAAHATIDQVVPHDARSILDLGCGDGALLARLKRARPDATCIGLEADAGRCERGRRRHPELLIDHARIEEHPERPILGACDVVLLMPGRLLEMSESSAQGLRSWLATEVARPIVYAYGDRLPLLTLLEQTGLSSARAIVLSGPGVEVAALTDWRS